MTGHPRTKVLMETERQQGQWALIMERSDQKPSGYQAPDLGTKEVTAHPGREQVASEITQAEEQMESEAIKAISVDFFLILESYTIFTAPYFVEDASENET